MSAARPQPLFLAFFAFLIIVMGRCALANEEDISHLRISLIIESRDKNTAIQLYPTSPDFPFPSSTAYLPPRDAQIQFLDNDNIRVTFEQPVKLAMVDTLTGRSNMARIIKSMVVRPSVLEYEGIQSVAGAKYFVDTLGALERAQIFIRRGRQEQFDYSIREIAYHPGNAPSLRQIDSIQFTVPLQDLQNRSAAPIKHVFAQSRSVTSRSPNSDVVEFPAVTNVARIYQTFAADHPFVAEFFALYEKMEAHREHLLRQGWFDPLIKKGHAHAAAAVPAEIITATNVVSLAEQRNRCIYIFSIY